MKEKIMDETLSSSNQDHAKTLNWEVVKNKIRHKWKKIEGKDLESLKDNLAMLSEKLQSIYSYPKTKADKEYREFSLALEHKPSHH